MKQHEKLTIILVDDDEGHAELTMLNLKRSGISNEIHYFPTGRSALGFLFKHENSKQENNYLMLLDINMPGLDGRQVLEIIKNNAHTKNMPVIMLTTTENEEEIKRCYALGCDLFVTKPMAYEEFSDTIHELGTFIQNMPLSQVMKTQAS